MSIESIAKWLEESSLGTAIAEGAWTFPIIESLHVLAISLVVGSIVIVDLRLLDRTWRSRAVSELTLDVLPWTWASFAVAAITGSLLFVSAATKYIVDTPFQLKMCLIALAGLNMAIFQFFTYRSVHEWDRDRATPRGARIAGGLSISFWIGVIACGRWIGFTVH
jgi:hypothetical protein